MTAAIEQCPQPCEPDCDFGASHCPNAHLPLRQWHLHSDEDNFVCPCCGDTDIYLNIIAYCLACAFYMPQDQDRHRPSIDSSGVRRQRLRAAETLRSSEVERLLGAVTIPRSR